MSDTPYSDRHAMTVESAASTCDPQMLVVPRRKAINLELDLLAARNALREIIDRFEQTHYETYTATVGRPELDRWANEAKLLDDYEQGIEPKGRELGPECIECGGVMRETPKMWSCNRCGTREKKR